MDDFLVRAFIAGIGVALVAGPLGCFVVWRRMSYLGDTIAHSSLLGVSLAVLLDTHLVFAVFLAAFSIALLLLALERKKTLSSDALLGILSHSSLAIGLVGLSFLAAGQGNLMSYLFGEILAVSTTDIFIIYSGGATVLCGLIYFWRTLLADTASPELAAAEGMNPALARIVFMLMIAALIALTMKIIGILLITALLIIPAATARRFAQSPEQMAAIAAIIGVFSVLSGLYGSLQFDTPASPSIVVAAFVFFALSLIPLTAFGEKQKK